jgi:hypothetical protein
MMASTTTPAKGRLRGWRYWLKNPLFAESEA